ncbi:DUF3318 domain-containing protein [Romeria aff. gracilis LEGE 07310]|uniref:DUF3318 domain-containing protein n=1 Tax=Vasconcelosia minhoensis LEGE 07310 TaxID=915328 RepID=A0A8J7AFD5_9CYAN|nr:DUF3318 domain-containing protein [Romeria gracilis]MBE9076468.1 DUF3318 domain-containing protein [Romeria aff. gracilis LEGE 07310]
MSFSNEIPRLRDLMSATGRMKVRIQTATDAAKVIQSPFPKPWKPENPVFINFDLWHQLPQPQRDLVFLREVSWLTAVRIFKVDIYQGVAIAGLFGALFELAQGDAIGLVTAGGLTAFAGAQVWRSSRGTQAEITADESALRVAQRRGYNLPESAQYLIEGTEGIAELERRPLTFIELLRCQSLRAVVRATQVSDKLRTE